MQAEDSSGNNLHLTGDGHHHIIAYISDLNTLHLSDSVFCVCLMSVGIKTRGSDVHVDVFISGSE